MAVEVEHRHGSDNHPNGEQYNVKDGHLFVYNDERDVAVYSPGNWNSARITPKD